MEIKQFGSFEEAQAFAKENNKKVYVFKKILSEKDEWERQEEATGPFDLGFITNPKNGRVKGLNEVSLDRTYYLKDYSLGVALLLEDYKKQKKVLEEAYASHVINSRQYWAKKKQMEYIINAAEKLNHDVVIIPDECFAKSVNRYSMSITFRNYPLYVIGVEI